MTPTAKMKLFFSPTSPYARKVLACAHEVGLADALELVTMTVSPAQPNHDYAVRNPLMKVPALERADGVTLLDSVVICEYLDAKGGGKLFPREGDARWLALRLHALADGVLDAALLARYETMVRPAPLRWDAWVDGQYAKIDHTLDALDADAATLERSFDIGQLALACALGYLDFRFAQRPWRDGRDALARWHEHVSPRASLHATRPPAA
ncbi:MAG: glutathione S-transferase family protein [Casimicrobiaceae bacterium]